jgi:sugar lactone lactonase YvrE
MLRISTRAVAACSIAFLTACSSAPSQSQIASLPNAQLHRPSFSRAKAWSNVYLLNTSRGNGYISVYANGTSHVLYEIKPGVTYAQSIVFDPAGNAYVYNPPPQQGTNCIIVFAATKNRRLYSINGGTEYLGAPAIDSLGNLYVPLPRKNRILVYAAGTKRVIRKITAGLAEPSSPVFDSDDNLFVLNAANSTVVEFAAGTNQPSRTIPVSQQSSKLAVDPSGNLYVLSLGPGYNQPFILVFAPNKKSPETKIKDGLLLPESMAFDSKGDLFVLNSNYITAYAPGATTPYLTFDKNTAGSVAMAIDAANDLYVANIEKGYFGVGSFKVYALDSNKLLRKVSRDMNNPIALAIGP